MSTRATLVMDAGQTGVRIEIRDPSDTATGTTAASYEYPGVRTDMPLAPQLAELACRALGDAGRSADLMAAGVSGLTPRMPVDALAAALTGSGVRRVRLAHDSVTSYLAALGDARGAVVAAGTGVVTLAVGRESWTRVDGWGHLIGDAGSGYWIGRAALDAVMRAHDGRGPATALTPLAVAEFGDLEDAYVQLQRDERRVSRIAAWSRTVAHLADEGDEVCRSLLERAGRELALSVLAGLRRVDERGDTHVSRVGKVFGSDAVCRSFEGAVRDALPEVRFTQPLGEGIDGAARLATLDLDSPLGRTVRVVDVEAGRA